MAHEEKPGTSRTTVIVALIGLVSALGVAIIGKFGSISFLSSSPPMSCVNISGTYKSNNGETAVVVQKENECSTQADIQDSNNPTVTIHVVGQMKADSGNYTAVVIYNASACTVRFYGYIINVTRVSYETEVYRTDGNCSFSTNFAQNLTWTRVGG
jgi:hypothetical protein